MSDCICSYQKLTDLINNDHVNKFESFKQILYGTHSKAHTSKTACSNHSTEINRKDSFNNQDKGRGSKRAHSDNSYRVNEDKERALGKSCDRDSQEGIEYFNFDDFEKLSVCFIKSLGKARKEHIKLQERIEDRRQLYCDIPRTNFCETSRRNQTNFGDKQSSTQTNVIEFQPNAGFQVNASGNAVLPSRGGGTLQINQQKPEYVDSGRISTSLSEVESFLNDYNNDVYLDDDMSAIIPSFLDSPSANPETYETLSSVIATAQTAKPTTLKCNTKHRDRGRKMRNSHNMSERRIVFDMNDKTKHIGTLLPPQSETKSRQNKGYILKASVEYIKKVKKEQKSFETFEEKIRQNELGYKKMMSRIMKLEIMTNIKRFDKILSDAHLKSNYRNKSLETKNQSASLESNTSSPFKKTSSKTLISQRVSRNSNTIKAATSTIDVDDATDGSMLSTESFSPCSLLSSGIYEDDINYE